LPRSQRSPWWLPAVALWALLLFNNSVRTAKKTQHFTIAKISLLMLFKEIIAVYAENHTKQKNTVIDGQAGGTDIYHEA
jgi:hypothetical protein